jgi:hypothetical protein
MPNIREISYNEFLDLSRRYGEPLTNEALGEIKKQVLEGKKLTISESAFSDPGPDFSEVFLEGQSSPLVHIRGY